MRAETDQKVGLAERLRANRYKAAAAIAALGLAFGATPAGSVEKPINLRNIYPNATLARQGYFLDGINDFDPSGRPSRSVLWFDLKKDGAFELHNSLPPEDCHTDYLQWKKNYLNYTETSNQCGDNDRQVILSPGVGFMPRTWSPSKEWTMSGTSFETHIDHGKLVCAGVLKWSSKVLGRERVRPGVYGIRTQTDQETTWTFGSSEFGCPIGKQQEWREGFTLGDTDQLPVEGKPTSAAGLLKSEGGNVYNNSVTGRWDWSVNFYGWAQSPPTRVNK